MERQSTSKVNNTEASLALLVLRTLPLAAKSVMVISFYKAQETLLKAVFAEAGIAEVAGDGTSGARGTLRILSVDQAQGSEADVVILSCVRSNRDAAVGFVKNSNRLNVAVSRARERLVVIGDPATIVGGGGPNWRSLFQRCSVLPLTKMIPAMVTANKPSSAAR